MTDILGAHVLRDLDIEALATTFPTVTGAGRTSLIERLSNPTNDCVELAKKQAELRSIRACVKQQSAAVAAARTTLKECEEAVRSVADAAQDKRHSEYYNQILWTPGTWLARLNPMGWLVELMVLFRTILLPGLAVIMPLLLLVAPIILFKFVLKRDLNLTEYIAMLKQSLQKAMPSVLGKPRFSGRGGPLEMGEQFIHFGATAAMFIASIWNQVSAALSMRRVVADMRERADAVRRFTEATQKLGELLGRKVEVPIWATGELGLFGDAWNTPERVTQLLKTAGELDMLVAVGSYKRLCFVRWGPTLSLTDMYHPGTGEKRIYNSVTMGGSAKPHVLLTGPNRGGKSTLLKGLGIAVLMSQTFGVVFARKATMPIFAEIITALNPVDVLGRLSLFESEIEFAKDVRARIQAATGPVFLMMDEIFHGTNAHDGVEAATIFLDDLYAAAGTPIYSVISTHYMGLPERYGEKQTQNLCMDASVDPENRDRLIYTYRVRAGVNGLSSVREILQERGLLVCRGTLPGKTSQDGSKAA
jgi:hypothetical protein